MPFQPCIDGTLLRERPIAALRAGSAKGVAVLTGTTREEWKLFTAMHPGIRMLNRPASRKRVW